MAQAIFFYFAGHETSSTMLCHLTNVLAQHEKIQKRLQKEVDKAMEVCNGSIDYETLVKMKYLDMVLSGMYLINMVQQKFLRGASIQFWTRFKYTILDKVPNIQFWTKF